jgi:hypothetical protein
MNGGMNEDMNGENLPGSGEPIKSGYWVDPEGNKVTGSEMQNIDDLMELRDSIESHPEGLILGQVIVCMIDLVADTGTTFKDVRDVRTGEGWASFLLTDHEIAPARITLDFPYDQGESQSPQTTKEPAKSLHAKDLSGDRISGGEYQGITDLMELAEGFDDHEQGVTLGWVLTSIRSLFEDAGDVYKDARDLRTGDGYASFLITQHSDKTARITFTFEHPG